MSGTRVPPISRIPALRKWLDDRLPIIRLAHDSFVDFPTPKKPQLLVHVWRYPGGLSGHPDRDRGRPGDALYRHRR